MSAGPLTKATRNCRVLGAKRDAMRYKNSLTKGEKLMKKFAVAFFIIAFATPAFAADYYVALRLGGGGGCVVMSHAPSLKKYKMMGKYSSKARARAAMAGMAECH